MQSTSELKRSALYAIRQGNEVNPKLGWARSRFDVLEISRLPGRGNRPDNWDVASGFATIGIGPASKMWRQNMRRH